jgi:hypothetical protein
VTESKNVTNVRRRARTQRLWFLRAEDFPFALRIYVLHILAELDPHASDNVDAVSRPHFSLARPLNCFQFPSIRFQSMMRSFFRNYRSASQKVPARTLPPGEFRL